MLMNCQVCGHSPLIAEMDMGNHPVASFYLTGSDSPERPVNLRLGQCINCGTIQLVEPVAHPLLVSPYDWIVSREPERHLDQVVAHIVAETKLPLDAVIAGLTYKDDTTLERFRRDHGYVRIWRLDIRDDLGVQVPNASIETIQKMIEPATMADIAERRGGQVDLLIVRHVIEHAENLQQFISGLAALVKPGGYLMLEAPDCSANLALGDACMVWEEHSVYFTPATFCTLLSSAGFAVSSFENHAMPFENCMVLLARKQGPAGTHLVSEAARQELGVLKSYAAAFTESRHGIRSYLEKVRRSEGAIAIFGAGHLACAFLCFYGIADLVDCVVDDTPEKQGLFLPGAKLPIYPSRSLVDRNIRLCLLAVSPTSEDAIIARNSAFLEVGGRFFSILAASLRSVHAYKS